MSQRQRAQLKLQLMKAERLAADTGDSTDVDRIKAELQEIEQQLGVASGAPANSSATLTPLPTPTSPSPTSTTPRQNEQSPDSHIEKLRGDLENVQKLHQAKDKEIEELKKTVATREQEMGNLGKLKADGAEKDLLIAELHSKLSKLVCERDEKSSTLKASQDKNALQSLLEPTKQEDIKASLTQLNEEKKHKILELKVLREEKKKFKRLSSQKEDLEYRVRQGDERLDQLDQEHRELTEQLEELSKKREETAPPPPKPVVVFEKKDSAEKLQKMGELTRLYEQVLAQRQTVSGSNMKPVVFKWLGSDAPYVVLYGDFPGERFSVPHLMTCGTDQVWTTTLYLPSGIYRYKFTINGADAVEESLPKDGANNIIVVQ